MNLHNNFKYNPFSGVLDDDIRHILVPRFDIEKMHDKIINSNSMALEFIGKKGRGKTTHLTFLQKLLPEAPLFLLNVQSSVDQILNHHSQTVFVDSIHHLSLADRIQLFKQKKKVIYTTHWTRKLDCFIAKKEHFSIRFKGIDRNTLLKIINKRLEFATIESQRFTPFSMEQVDPLIKTYGDNYRGIMNHLFETHQ